MQTNELIDKALELQQLVWWLDNPTIKSFFLSCECHSNNENRSFYLKIQNSEYNLTVDITARFLVMVSNYPIDINKTHNEHVYRPYPTDVEIETRIDHILYTLTFDGTP